MVEQIWCKREWIQPTSNLQILLAKKIGRKIVVEEDGATLEAYAVGDKLYVTDFVYKEKRMAKFKIGDIVKVVNGGYGIAKEDEGCKVRIVCIPEPGKYHFRFVDKPNSELTYYEYDKADEYSFELVERSSSMKLPQFSVRTYDSWTEITISHVLTKEQLATIIDVICEKT